MSDVDASRRYKGLPGGRSLTKRPRPLIDLRLPSEEWVAGALCAQTDPEIFFPEKGGGTKAAKEVCAACDVRLRCLRWALEHDEQFGIWGGLSANQRNGLRGRRVA